jgi:hypothetical protein
MTNGSTDTTLVRAPYNTTSSSKGNNRATNDSYLLGIGNSMSNLSINSPIGYKNKYSTLAHTTGIGYNNNYSTVAHTTGITGSFYRSSTTSEHNTVSTIAAAAAPSLCSRMHGYIIVDASYSMVDRIDKAVDGIHNICSNSNIFKAGDTCSILMFNQTCSFILKSLAPDVINWTRLRTKLHKAVRDDRAFGTDMFTAVTTVLDRAEQSVSKYTDMVQMFVITDGGHNANGKLSEDVDVRIDDIADSIHNTPFKQFNFTIMAISMPRSFIDKYERWFCNGYDYCKLVQGSGAHIAQQFSQVSSIMQEQRETFSTMTITIESSSGSKGTYQQSKTMTSHSRQFGQR